MIGRVNASQYKINYFHTCADIDTTQLPRCIAAIRIPPLCTTILASYAPELKARSLLLWSVDMQAICGKYLDFPQRAGRKYEQAVKNAKPTERLKGDELNASEK